MELGLKGKRALVTGASRGLGRQIALDLAGEGVQVAAVARDAGSLNALVEELGGAGRGHSALSIDLMADGAIKDLRKRLEDSGEFPDIVVHNLGGTLGLRNYLGGMEEYQKVWQFNVGIPIEINSFCLPAMGERKWGRVVHISSASAVKANASVPYSSAKAALNCYVQGLSRQVAAQGVVVSAVMPGPFIADGGHWDNIAKNDPEWFNWYISERMATKRLGTPEEISGLVTFLCSNKASLFVGSIVPVDGGLLY